VASSDEQCGGHALTTTPNPAPTNRRLALTRPLAFIDLETTGLNTASDRIVEIGILKVMPDGRKHQFYAKLNPEQHISAGASGVHGIEDGEVANRSKFKDITPRVLELLADCDLAGFNVAKFDLLLLQEEFRRVGIEFSLANRGIIDVQRIYHAKEPRDLTAAYKFYCDANHTNAHSAFEDARVCWKVLQGQLERYPDLPNTNAGLAEFCARTKKGGRFMDLGRWFEAKVGEPHFTRGKHVGRALKEVAETDSDYLDWMLGEDVPEDTALMVARALRSKR
jgi:DNA polymerase-3 subunit epsilon